MIDDHEPIASDDELRLWDLEDLLNEMYDAIRIIAERARDSNLTEDEVARVGLTIQELRESREFLQNGYFELKEKLENPTPADLPSRFKKHD